VRIETKPLKELKPADYNPRIISDAAYEGLKTSIARFGLVQPIVWNELTGNVVSGHQRLRVLQEQGVSATDVVVVSLDDADEKALNVTQNNENITGAFTEDLEPLLLEIRDEIGVEDLEGLRLDSLMMPEMPEFTPIDDDEAPPPFEPKRTKCPNCGAEW
jgi:ParB-like chromosome segregation protein Spo0J